jgi:esterase/lipase superfamily enzyme
MTAAKRPRSVASGTLARALRRFGAAAIGVTRIDAATKASASSHCSMAAAPSALSRLSARRPSASSPAFSSRCSAAAKPAVNSARAAAAAGWSVAQAVREGVAEAPYA